MNNQEPLPFWVKLNPKRNLTPQDVMVRLEDVQRRLWSSYQVNPNNGCWEWTKHLSQCGYGKIRCFDSMATAHRLSFFFTYGAVGPDVMVCHSCDNRLCINPEHLFLGNAMDNYADMVSKGRDRHAKGEGVNLAKLTDEIVMAMRREYKFGVTTYADLGKKYNVYKETVQHAVVGDTWKHLPNAKPRHRAKKPTTLIGI